MNWYSQFCLIERRKGKFDASKIFCTYFRGGRWLPIFATLDFWVMSINQDLWGLPWTSSMKALGPIQPWLFLFAVLCFVSEMRKNYCGWRELIWCSFGSGLLCLQGAWGVQSVRRTSQANGVPLSAFLNDDRKDRDNWNPDERNLFFKLMCCVCLVMLRQGWMYLIRI